MKKLVVADAATQINLMSYSISVLCMELYARRPKKLLGHGERCGVFR